jgi:hypothetical protein
MKNKIRIRTKSFRMNNTGWGALTLRCGTVPGGSAAECCRDSWAGRVSTARCLMGGACAVMRLPTCCKHSKLSSMKTHVNVLVPTVSKKAKKTG